MSVKTFLKQTKGYTIDQTILVVAVIAILITLVISTVGWDLLNRTGGTKIAAQLRQVEDANSTFYARMRLWPHEVLQTANEANAALALADKTVLDAAYQDKHSNLLQGMKVDGGELQHKLGGGGAVYQDEMDVSTISTDMSGLFMVVELDRVPFSEAQEADETIDGEVGYNNGRLVYTVHSSGYSCGNAPTEATSGFVDICYIANRLD